MKKLLLAFRSFPSPVTLSQGFMDVIHTDYIIIIDDETTNFMYNALVNLKGGEHEPNLKRNTFRRAEKRIAAFILTPLPQ